MAEYKRKQDLVTLRIEREIREALKELALKEDRTMASQLKYMIKQAGGNI